MSREVYEKIAPNLKRVSLERGKILHAPGEIIREFYFPIDCLLSITITMSDGSTAETGMVGTQAAQKLQESGLIRYSRGHVHILDQPGLEAASCECFRTVRDEYDRLLGGKQRDSA